MPIGNGESGLLGKLRRQIVDILGGALGQSRDCALAGFPEHWNVGDSAIWLGCLAALDEIGARVRYTCGHLDYNPVALSTQLPHGPILLSGGGNMGDVYPDEQGLRERVIRDFGDRQIIQLPQSIWFRDRANIAPQARLIGQHRQFTLMVRDRQSMQFAADNLRVQPILCPDMALAVHPEKIVRATPACDILWLARTDCESATPAVATESHGGLTVERTDWLVSSSANRGLPAYSRAANAIYDRLAGCGTHPSLAAFGRRRLALKRVEYGVRLLSRGRAVITDRLHGHILCMLAGIPHVILDNCYRKLNSFHETWCSESRLARRAVSAEEALRIAAEIAGAVKAPAS